MIYSNLYTLTIYNSAGQNCQINGKFSDYHIFHFILKAKKIFPIFDSMEHIKSSRFIVLTLLVIAAALTRALPYLIPHIWNFTAIGALAIFAGAQFNDRRLAFIMPLAAMAISDLFIGNGFSLLVYTGFVAMVACGFLIRNKVNLSNVVLASFISAAVFFLITNFSFFYATTLYPRNLSGIMASYAAGLPFFRNMLIGNLAFSAVLFSSLYLLTKRYPVLAKV